MKALSILQPWAWLIVRPDLADAEERARAAAEGLIKDIENRTWHTPYRGHFLVHAGKRYSKRDYADDAEDLWDFHRITLPPYDELERGGVVGQARIVDCVREHPSKWKMADTWGFVLTEQKPLVFTPYRGQLGWFDIPRELVAANQPVPARA